MSHHFASSALLLFAVTSLTNSDQPTRNPSGREEPSYEQEFLNALQHGPLTNSTPYQYVSESIRVPRAAADESRLAEASVKKAAAYLDQGAEAWNATAKCVSCHTNGSYMAYRPALTDQLGPPSPQMHEFFTKTLRQQMAMPRADLSRGLGPTQVVYVASGLAQWDAHVTHRLSLETRQALELMFDIQELNGAWHAPGDCWPPFESDSYQGSAMAAMTVASAPGWLADLHEKKYVEGVERLKHYLRMEPPPHDYGRVFLLWAASALRDLLSAQAQHHLIDVLWKHQRSMAVGLFALSPLLSSGEQENGATNCEASLTFEILRATDIRPASWWPYCGSGRAEAGRADPTRDRVAVEESTSFRTLVDAFPQYG